MTCEMAVSNSLSPFGHRYSLNIQAQDGSLKLAIPQGSGAWFHILIDHHVAIDSAILDKAVEQSGSPQHIGTIELDDNEIVRLMRHRIN